MTDALRLLVVEDSPTDAKLVVQALAKEGRALVHERVETASAMRAALETKGWDVVVSDWSMPKFSALAALEVLKASGLDLPFIIVSGTVGEEHAVAAMRAGAHDYVLKDKLGRLAPAVDREIRERIARRAHRSAELARIEAELRFGRLFEAGIMGVTISDDSGVIVDANDAFLTMVGYARDDLRAGALSWKEMTPPEWVPHNLVAREQLRLTGRAKPFEKEYTRKDGTALSVLVGVAALDESRFLTVVTDLTDRKRAEQAKVALEEQLRQSQKMEAVGRLAGGVAHDFNNLLSVVLGYSEMLIADLEVGDPIRADIEEIRRAGQRATALTRQLLMFSRQQVVEPKVVNLDEVLLSMDKMLRRLVGEDVELTSIPYGALGRVRVDPGAIEQVIMNLAINARDAMPTGGKLTMETANVSLDEAYTRDHLGVLAGPHVMVSMTDSGTGMDKATLARIFEPFFTTKETGKGTGLGLSMVFGIVQQSGGHVWVYSEPGVGTTFKVYLPRVDAEAEASRAQRPPTTLRGTETILLVEDEDQVRDVARGILRRHGYVVIEARNAGEALLLCEQHEGTIDLLLTDVVMPQMSGPELAKRLARARPEMRVLCMSGYTDDAAVRHGVIEAKLAYLQKPITVETLTKKVRDVLDVDLGAG